MLNYILSYLLYYLKNNVIQKKMYISNKQKQNKTKTKIELIFQNKYNNVSQKSSYDIPIAIILRITI